MPCTSGLGYSATCRYHRGMSVLPRKTDDRQRKWHVCSVPGRNSCTATKSGDFRNWLSGSQLAELRLGFLQSCSENPLLASPTAVALAVSGHTTAAPPTRPMNSRRFMLSSKPSTKHYHILRMTGLCATAKIKCSTSAADHFRPSRPDLPSGRLPLHSDSD